MKQRRKIMPKVEKDQFGDVPEEFKEVVEGLGTDDIRKKVAEIALNQVELMKAKKEDQDLAEKREQYKSAGEIYSSGTKLNRKKIEYLKTLLESKGGA